MSLESFMLKDEVKEVEYVASNRFVDKEGKLENANISRLPKFNVNVTGYMVQADNVEKDEAVKELTALVQK